MHIDWRPYAGGFIGAEAIVGICGPHPNGLYSVTFYRSPVERRWELFVASEAKAQATAEHVLGIWERRRERDTAPDPAVAPQGLAPAAEHGEG